MRSLLRSIMALFSGVVSRFIFWLPFILLDISDYWEKYIRPGILHFTGKDAVMPSGTLLGAAGVGIVCSVILTYHELHTKKLEQDEELAPNVEIESTPTLQEWTSSIVGKPGKPCRAFYITVRNPSAKPIHNVSVYLTDISPRVANLDWLPIPLHIKHDNKAPPKESFDMNPRGVRHIDLVSYMASEPYFTIEHTVGGVNKKAAIATYILTVRVEGAAITSPFQTKFMAKLDYLGRLICLPAAYIDLDKGLMEFNADAKTALERLTPIVTKMGRVTGGITTVIQDVTQKLDAALKEPFKWYETLLGRNTIADRIKWYAPRWSRTIDRVTEDLKESTALYVSQANDVILNMTGYAELTHSVSKQELDLLKQFFANMIKALEVSKAFRASVASNQTMRVTTDIARSMKFLGSVLDLQIEATERMSDSLGLVVSLLEQKLNKL